VTNHVCVQAMFLAFVFMRLHVISSSFTRISFFSKFYPLSSDQIRISIAYLKHEINLQQPTNGLKLVFITFLFTPFNTI
jgi:hypothetical protein